jgi:CheY-like chemotaxis protein
MIVEDDARVRNMIRRIIDDLVVTVYECAGGEEAVEVYRRIRPEVVLMDLRMEGVDGLNATRTIRESDPEARIIIVTSHDAPDLREAAREAGAMEYVVKDDLSSLRSIVKRATESA